MPYGRIRYQNGKEDGMNLFKYADGDLKIHHDLDPVPAPEKPKSVTPKKRKSVRTIEIDPDLADRIYFRKSG